MKTSNLFLLSLLLFIPFLFNSCSDDDALEPINEEELITTLILTFQPTGGGSPVEYRFTDLDGDGGNPPVVTVQGDLVNFTDYNLSVRFLNETENPAEEITEEVLEEDTDHQVFFIVENTLALTINYDDTDPNGKPIGLKNKARTEAASSGKLTVILRHFPNKSAVGVAQGDATNAGGDTDIEVTFDVEIAS